MGDLNRRNFIKSIGIAGAVGATATFAEENANKPETQAPAKAETKKPKVQTRVLGKTGLVVPVLAPGIMYNTIDNQSVLLASVMKNTMYWDTAHSYSGGNSELGMGKFLAKRPGLRDKMILATKASGAKDNASRDARLQTSFDRLQTDYIDIYYGIHAMSNPDQLTTELKEWAQKAKEEKKIKFFGITTHKNMAECLHACAESGFIDVVMTSYNFRLMQDEKMQAAVEAANKANIGLVAMKVMSGKAQIETDDDMKIAGEFIKQGLTPAQAKIKAVLSDKRFSIACMTMTNVREFNENLKAVLDDTQLSFDDHQRLGAIAKAGCSGYCSGCSEICTKATGNPYISDAMRCLMYHDSYGDREMAMRVFEEIPAQFRAEFASRDFAEAEMACPNKMPITRLMKRVSRRLT